MKNIELRKWRQTLLHQSQHRDDLQHGDRTLTTRRRFQNGICLGARDAKIHCEQHASPTLHQSLETPRVCLSHKKRQNGNAPPHLGLHHVFPAKHTPAPTKSRGNHRACAKHTVALATMQTMQKRFWWSRQDRELCGRLKHMATPQEMP